MKLPTYKPFCTVEEQLLHRCPDPTALTFVGHRQVQGTAAAIEMTPDSVVYRSNRRALSLDNDNQGFVLALELEGGGDLIRHAARKALGFPLGNNDAALTGVWAGPGINGNPHDLTFRTFVVTKVRWGSGPWQEPKPFRTSVLRSVCDFHGECAVATVVVTEDRKVRGADKVPQGFNWHCTTHGLQSSRYWWRS